MEWPQILARENGRVTGKDDWCGTIKHRVNLVFTINAAVLFALLNIGPVSLRGQDCTPEMASGVFNAVALCACNGTGGRSIQHLRQGRNCIGCDFICMFDDLGNVMPYFRGNPGGAPFRSGRGKTAGSPGKMTGTGPSSIA